MMNMEWSILPGYAREEEIRELFTEYTDMVLAGDPAFAGYLARQHYEDELAHPARKYAPPHGRLYLVCTGSTPVGCAALKALDDTRCEMKRLYVRPEYRGQGIARALVHQLMQEARVAGYRQMVLDTFPFLPEAITLYKREGFYEIERYNDNPMPGSVYLCCEL
ncbi:MAG: GNAT family N-acetyltransferase [Angelakisella sp.]|jgi:hypothetical protein